MEPAELVDPPTEPTPENIETLSPDVPAPAFDAAALRSDWATRIRAEGRLPGGLRERLATAVEESAQLANATTEPQLSVSQVAELFAESLPRFLPTESRLAVHPAGERFFQGGADSSQEAARLAREQLRRTGFGRETD